MDQKRIDEMKKICNATPNGPWYVRYTDDDSHMNMTVISTQPQPKHHDHQVYDGEPDTICIVMHQLLPAVNDGGNRDEEIAAFIAESRMALPEALAEIERQRADLTAYQGIAVELAQAQAEMKRFQDNYLEVLAALDDLSFASCSVFHHDPRFIAVYNRTFDVLQKHIKALEAEIIKPEVTND